MTGTRPISMLHMFPSFAMGGQQMRLAQLARGLGPAFRHEILSFDGDVSAASLFDKKIGIEKFELAKTSILSWSNLAKLRARISSSNADIVCTYNWGALEGALANRFGERKPHIHFEDGFGPDENIDQQKLRRVLFRRLALANTIVVTPSKTLYRVATEKWRLPERRVFYIPNGVDKDRFQPHTPTTTTMDVIVGAVGALRIEKNQKRLIQSFCDAKLGDRAQLEIVGDGGERSNLERFASGIGGSHNIIFCGSTNTPENAYRRFDVFALSSNTEQMPISVLEAMAAGLPIVATDVGDVKFMVGEENRPFITALGDEVAYTKALHTLSVDPERRAHLGQANRQRVLKEFAAEKMINAHGALYGKIYGGDDG